MQVINLELPFLLSDIGSSKGKWILFSADGSVRSFHTAGYSPNYSEPTVIKDIVFQLQEGQNIPILSLAFFLSAVLNIIFKLKIKVLFI